MDNSSNNQKSFRDEQFLRLLIANQDKIYAFILTLVHNSTDAEDILQDATTVMWRKYDTFTPGTSFIAWGITIARMHVLKFFEKNRNCRLSFSSDLEQQLAVMAQQKLTSTQADIVKIRQINNSVFPIGSH